MITYLHNYKKLFISITLFFLLVTSINAKIFITVENSASSGEVPGGFPGELIRVFAVANEKLENLHVLLSTQNREEIARFEGFKYDPGKIIGADNKPLNFVCMVAIISTGSTISWGKYIVSVYINNEESPRKEFPLFIKQKEFTRETIHLNQALSDLRTDTSGRRERESQELFRLLSKFNKENVFTDTRVMKPFLVEPYYITSRYGDIRRFVYRGGATANSIHHGIDYAAEQGSSVFACAAGKVVFAGERLITGYTVVIEHLPGLYSLYYHLDKIYVIENTFVSKGVIIGLLGNTGLSTAAHLHWEIRNQGKTVDPDFLIENPMIDKDKIISIIKSDFADMAEGR